MHALREPGAGVPGVGPGSPAGDGRPTRALVDLSAFSANLRLAGRLAGGAGRVLAVLKADAYGHGAVPLARAAERGGAWGAGVATAAEAEELRAGGVGFPVLVLSEVPVADAPRVVRAGAAQVVYTAALAEALAAAAAGSGRRVAVHLKVDTGMGRVGVRPEDAAGLARRIRELPGLELAGVLTHLAASEDLAGAVTGEQLGRFAAAVAAIEGAAGPVPLRHAANSGLLLRGEAGGNLARPGIMLYGEPPGPNLPHAAGLRPVLTLATAVAFLKRVPAGTPVSYGGTFVTARESLLATLPVGYADGYRRRFSNAASVLVRGRRAPVAGTVCMDLTVVDVTEVPGVGVGDEVVLIGSQGGAAVGAGELAAIGGTISYEVFCGIGRRVPRLHRRAELGYDLPAMREGEAAGGGE